MDSGDRLADGLADRVAERLADRLADRLVDGLGDRLGDGLGDRLGDGLGVCWVARCDTVRACWSTVGLTAPLRQGLTSRSQVAIAPRATAHKVQPSAVVPTPTYFRPEARITNVMIGRIYLSGARDDK